MKTLPIILISFSCLISSSQTNSPTELDDRLDYQTHPELVEGIYLGATVAGWPTNASGERRSRDIISRAMELRHQYKETARDFSNLIHREIAKEMYNVSKESEERKAAEKMTNDKIAREGDLFLLKNPSLLPSYIRVSTQQPTPVRGKSTVFYYIVTTNFYAITDGFGIGSPMNQRFYSMSMTNWMDNP